ncbi:hypothetical protein H8A02_08360, partial [Neisseria meningitidis]|nr:hypothetical protein [Neisseria meningitidis]
PRGEALAVVVALIAAMGYTIISLEWLPHMSIIAPSPTGEGVKLQVRRRNFASH